MEFMPVWGIGWPEVMAFLTVVAIDVALAGDNALVVGMAAAGLPEHNRRRAIMIGIVAAALLRIVFAIFTVHLLQVVGLTMAGGILLLWVSWKLWREIRHANQQTDEEEDAPNSVGGVSKNMRQAVTQIVFADLSMSLDNVLAVAGAARDHIGILIAGLALSVILMGVAASLIARLIHRHRWIAYIGLLIIFYVSLSMIWDGTHEVATHLNIGVK